jgi:1,4-alpha-glucan branching enzyme
VTIGAFTFVLHSHMPYARLAGRWPHGEEWIHEAACETYLPLLQTLYDLKEDNVNFKLTIGITPVLAEQLADPTVLSNLNDYIDFRIAAARRDMAHFAAANVTQIDGEGNVANTPAPGAPVSGSRDAHRQEDPHLYYLAEWYKTFYQNIKKALNERFVGDIIGAFRNLQNEGYIEIITCAATHGYLPLLSRDSSLRAQLEVGIQSYEKHFGRKPTGIWLPECAYRPAYISDEGETRVGLESLLAEYGLKVFFTETHTITGGQPVGVAAGNVIGPYGEVIRRYVIPALTEPIPKRDTTTFQAYNVQDTVKGADMAHASGVAAIGRNNNTGQQVWSADWGYPGDFDYREFHKKAGTSGLQYWRVTGAKVDLAHKDYYHPDWSDFKVEQHAEHFAHLVGDLLRDHHNQTGKVGLIASNYDTELFGHWWFEGVRWLGMVLRHLATSLEVELTTASAYLEQHPPQQTIILPESSWGAGGTHFTWDNGENDWMWKHIHAAEKRMEALATTYATASEAEATVLNQAAREILLLQSSDWAFLVTTGQAREYANQRFQQHVERFNKLADSLDRKAPNTALAQELYTLDNIFPEIDYRVFRKR